MSKTRVLSKKYDYSIKEMFPFFLKGENIDLLKSFLEEHNGINAVDEYKRTLLMNCIIDNNSSPKYNFLNNYAKELINCGADINRKDDDNHTAIHFCINKKNYEILDILLTNKNIDINVEPNLLQFIIRNDITNFSLMIELIEMGLDPFEKINGKSFFDVVKQFDDGTITRGGKKVDVKPIMDYLLKIKCKE